MVNSVLGKWEIELLVETRGGQTYRIQRKFGELPRVYDEDGDKLNIKSKEVFPIVGFGETELEKISYELASYRW